MYLMDGFKVTRPGDSEVQCKIKILLDLQSPRYKLLSLLYILLGVRIRTLPEILNALWNYVKIHKLQDPLEPE